MIRDPSDGSVREKKPIEPATGLREPKDRADYLERLNKSREWLKEYKSRKASPWQDPGAGNPTTHQSQ